MTITPHHTAVPETGDAFGQLLLDAELRAGLATYQFEVTERDDGHISVRDAYHYFLPVSAGSWEHHLLSAAQGRTLDIGCGAGRHSRFLAERGVDTLGIDVSAGAVAVCAERGVTAVHADIRTPPDLGQQRFGTFLMLGGNLGLLGSPHTARPLLSTLAGLAEPGARIMAEGIDLTTDDPIHTAYQDRNVAVGRHRTQVRMRIRHRRLTTDWIDLWFPPTSELAEIVEGTGWELTKVYDTGERIFYAVLTWTGQP